MIEYLIQAAAISKSFGSGNSARKVLNNVTVEIGAGEFTCIMGPSGSGKSTLLFALSGMETVDQGVVSFNGKNLAKLTEVQSADMHRRDMGFVFQQATLLKNLNILDNIILPSLHDKKSSKEAILQKAKRLMNDMGIDHIANNQISQSSGGELQRAGICRALMNSPKIIFGDEPTGALNSKTAQEIMKIFSDIHASGATILLVTHDARVAAHGKRVLFMRDGAIAADQRFPHATVKSVELDHRTREIIEQMEALRI